MQYPLFCTNDSTNLFLKPSLLLDSLYTYLMQKKRTQTSHIGRLHDQDEREQSGILLPQEGDFWILSGREHPTLATASHALIPHNISTQTHHTRNGLIN